MLRIVDQGIISRVPGRGAYMPVIAPLPDGTFIASQHVGTELGSPDNHIEVLRSTDGKTWENKGSIHPGGGPPDDGWAYRGPKISVVPDGRLVMTASRFVQRESLFDPDSEAWARCDMLVLWSEDGGGTWSDPEVVLVGLPRDRYNWNGDGTLLQLAGDRWMYPLETWKPEESTAEPDQKAAAVFPSDQGKTWGEFSVVADDESGKILWWDQMCSIMPDGRIYTLILDPQVRHVRGSEQPLDYLGRPGAHVEGAQTHQP